MHNTPITITVARPASMDKEEFNNLDSMLRKYTVSESINYVGTYTTPGLFEDIYIDIIPNRGTVNFKFDYYVTIENLQRKLKDTNSKELYELLSFSERYTGPNNIKDPNFNILNSINIRISKGGLSELDKVVKLCSDVNNQASVEYAQRNPRIHNPYSHNFTPNGFDDIMEREVFDDELGHRNFNECFNSIHFPRPHIDTRNMFDFSNVNCFDDSVIRHKKPRVTRRPVEREQDFNLAEHERVFKPQNKRQNNTRPEIKNDPEYSPKELTAKKEGEILYDVFDGPGIVTMVDHKLRLLEVSFGEYGNKSKYIYNYDGRRIIEIGPDRDSNHTSDKMQEILNIKLKLVNENDLSNRTLFELEDYLKYLLTFDIKRYNKFLSTYITNRGNSTSNDSHQIYTHLKIVEDMDCDTSMEEFINFLETFVRNLDAGKPRGDMYGFTEVDKQVNVHKNVCIDKSIDWLRKYCIKYFATTENDKPKDATDEPVVKEDPSESRQTAAKRQTTESTNSVSPTTKPKSPGRPKKTAGTRTTTSRITPASNKK